MPRDALFGLGLERRRTHVAACLVVVAISLLVFGAVNDTFVSHIVQILPMAAAVAMLRTWPSAPYAALGLFVFWLVGMSINLGLIITAPPYMRERMHVLGVSVIPHIAPMAVAASASLMGIWASLRASAGSDVISALAAFFGALVLQALAVALSM
jgi:hypothetical protein